MKKLLTALFCFFLLTNCQTVAKRGKYKEEKVHIYEGQMETNYVSDFPSMIMKAATIVEGKFIKEVATDEQVKFYTFQVDRVYKGKVAEKEIQIGLYHQLKVDGLNHEQGKPITFYIKHVSFVEPTIGKKTILFLGEKMKSFDLKWQGNGAYSTIVNPWYVEFDQRDLARLKTPPQDHQEIVTATDGKTKYKFITEYQDNLEYNHVKGKTYKEIVQVLNDYKQKSR
jgi:hypothetical protein